MIWGAYGRWELVFLEENISDIGGFLEIPEFWTGDLTPGYEHGKWGHIRIHM